MLNTVIQMIKWDNEWGIVPVENGNLVQKIMIAKKIILWVLFDSDKFSPNNVIVKISNLDIRVSFQCPVLWHEVGGALWRRHITTYTNYTVEQWER